MTIKRTDNILAQVALLLGLCSTLAPGTVGAATLIWGTGVWGDTWASSTGTTPPNPLTSSPPSSITGTAFKGQSDPVAASGAAFGIGLTTDSGTTYKDTSRVTDTVRIVGVIAPEAQHIGQTADIFVVDRVNLAFMMETTSGVFVPWDGRVPNLVPFREDVTLTSSLTLDIFTGTLGVAGDHRFFLGYLPADGTLRYTPTPIRLTISD